MYEKLLQQLNSSITECQIALKTKSKQQDGQIEEEDQSAH